MRTSSFALPIYTLLFGLALPGCHGDKASFQVNPLSNNTVAPTGCTSPPVPTGDVLKPIIVVHVPDRLFLSVNGNGQLEPLVRLVRSNLLAPEGAVPPENPQWGGDIPKPSSTAPALTPALTSLPTPSASPVPLPPIPLPLPLVPPPFNIELKPSDLMPYQHQLVKIMVVIPNGRKFYFEKYTYKDGTGDKVINGVGVSNEDAAMFCGDSSDPVPVANGMAKSIYLIVDKFIDPSNRGKSISYNIVIRSDAAPDTPIFVDPKIRNEG